MSETPLTYEHFNKLVSRVESLTQRIIELELHRVHVDMFNAGWYQLDEGWHHKLMGAGARPLTDVEVIHYHQETGGKTPPPF